MSSSPIETVRGLLDALGPVRGTADKFTARCPAHDDDGPSLSVRVGDDGRVLVHCFAGCSVREVADALGLTLADLFTSSLPSSSRRGIAGIVARRAEPPPVRLPSAEVAALWRACVPVVDDAETATYLRERRGIDPTVVADRDLARALPRGLSLPTWARCGRSSWSDSGHRLIVPAFDDAGSLVVLRARCVRPCAASMKALTPAGGSIKGAAFADALGRRMLAGLEMPARVVVLEGEMDFLAWAVNLGDALDEAPAVLGVAAGSWTRGIAARIPPGARVSIWTHDDDAGSKYAATIGASLRGRARVFRGAVTA